MTASLFPALEKALNLLLSVGYRGQEAKRLEKKFIKGSATGRRGRSRSCDATGKEMSVR